jgi:hypothetical protein
VLPDACCGWLSSATRIEDLVKDDVLLRLRLSTLVNITVGVDQTLMSDYFSDRLQDYPKCKKQQGKPLFFDLEREEHYVGDTRHDQCCAAVKARHFVQAEFLAKTLLSSHNLWCLRNCHYISVFLTSPCVLCSIALPGYTCSRFPIPYPSFFLAIPLYSTFTSIFTILALRFMSRNSSIIAFVQGSSRSNIKAERDISRAASFQ